MSPRLRVFAYSMLFALVSGGAALALLTLINHHLGDPSIAHFDLLWQARLHGLTRPALTSLMLTFTWLGSIKVFGTTVAVITLILVLKRRAHDASLLFLSLLGAFILNQTLKVHFHRARPHVPWSIGDEHTFSFPSGHSLFACVLYGTLAYFALHYAEPRLHKLGAALLAAFMALNIGMSRIYLGMHYPTDVAAGFLTGLIWLAAVIASDIAWHALLDPEENKAPAPQV
jgi:undecaprenyl-diphosphatase